MIEEKCQPKEMERQESHRMDEPDATTEDLFVQFWQTTTSLRLGW
jgi:hypothetical protein